MVALPLTGKITARGGRKSHDDVGCRRVHTPLSASRVACRPGAHSPVRLPQANRLRKHKLELCRALLCAARPSVINDPSPVDAKTGADLPQHSCPLCRARKELILVELLSPHPSFSGHLVIPSACPSSPPSATPLRSLARSLSSLAPPLPENRFRPRSGCLFGAATNAVPAFRIPIHRLHWQCGRQKPIQLPSRVARLSSMNSIGSAHADPSLHPTSNRTSSTPDRMLFINGRQNWPSV